MPGTPENSLRGGPGRGLLVTACSRDPPDRPHPGGGGVHRKHLEAMGRAPLPPLEAGPGARHTERRPDAAGPAVPQTKHGSGGPARTSHLTAHVKVAGTKHRSAVTGAGGAAHARTAGFRLPPGRVCHSQGRAPRGASFTASDTPVRPI